MNWKELESKFRALQPSLTEKKSLYALFSWAKSDNGPVEKCDAGGNPLSFAKFETLASIAAGKLGCTASEIAITFWLNHVFEWMRQNKIDKDKKIVWRSTCPQELDDGTRFESVNLRTERISELSADYCTKLIAQSTPETIIKNIPRSKRPIKPLTKVQKQRRKVIFGAIQSKNKGLKYCKTLDERNLAIPAGWIQDGCPATYSEAYRVPTWRKRIQDEKHRFGKLYSNTPVKERETIIQGATDTRGTRPDE
jgi:hypothetical protein